VGIKGLRGSRFENTSIYDNFYLHLFYLLLCWIVPSFYVDTICNSVYQPGVRVFSIKAFIFPVAFS
jgi:hypothetical protein